MRTGAQNTALIRPLQDHGFVCKPIALGLVLLIVSAFGTQFLHGETSPCREDFRLFVPPQSTTDSTQPWPACQCSMVSCPTNPLPLPDPRACDMRPCPAGTPQSSLVGPLPSQSMTYLCIRLDQSQPSGCSCLASTPRVFTDLGAL